MTLDEAEFATLADDVLGRLVLAIDAAAGDKLEADLRDGVLTIELESGGQYIVNKHTPTREIWVSSPLTGAWHFAYDEKRGWVDTRARGGGKPITLHHMLETELGEITDIAIRLGGHG
jgi:frataxin